MAVKRVVSPSTGVSTTRSARVRLRAGRAPGWLSMGTARAVRSRAEASSIGRAPRGERRAQPQGHREPATRRRGTTWVTGLLVVATLGMHALPAWYAAKAIDTLDAVALGGSAGSIDDSLPVFSGLPEPSGQPDVAAGERVNVLLVGVDSAPGRVTALTDTMLVVSLDTLGTRSAMISIPRDLYGAPLPNGQPFNNKLNALMTYADARPDEFPLGGVGTLKATIGRLLGGPVHYLAAINLLGFKQAVDALGG